MGIPEMPCPAAYGLWVYAPHRCPAAHGGGGAGALKTYPPMDNKGVVPEYIRAYVHTYTRTSVYPYIRTYRDGEPMRRGL